MGQELYPRCTLESVRVWYFHVAMSELAVWTMAKSRQVHILNEDGRGWKRSTSPCRKRSQDGLGVGSLNAFVPGHLILKNEFPRWLGFRLGDLGLTRGFLAVGVNREYEKDYGELKVHVMHDTRRFPIEEVFPEYNDLPARITPMKSMNRWELIQESC